MSAIHAGVAMASAAGNMNMAPNLSALGKALGETTISSPSPLLDPVSPSSLSLAPAAPATRKSPKKRERTDSMKKLIVPPAAQRAKSQGASFDGLDVGDQVDDEDDDDEEEDEEEDEEAEGEDEDDHDGLSDASSSAPDQSGIKLPVKDRTGSAIAGVSRVTLISNAVKTAPPAKEKSNPRRWSKAEDESLRLAVERSGERNWKAIAEQVPGRNHTQCLQRWTKVLKPGLIKGHWDPEEDAKLRDLVAEGKRNWGQVASLIPGRTSKQCRERWCNHLDPNINKGLYTEEEDRIIMEMQAKLGNRWSIIAQHLKGRTEDAVKIRWKSLMRGKKAAGKELQQQQQQNQSAATSTNAELLAAASFTPAVAAAPAAIPTNPSPQAAKPTRATPTKQKTRAASPVAKPLEPIAFKAEPTASQHHATSTAVMQQQQQQQQQQLPPPQPIHLPPSSSAGGVPIDASTGSSIDSTHVAASINSYMQNVNDLVAASIHNFRLSQNFSPGMQTSGPLPTTTSGVAATTAHMMATNSHASMMAQSTISPMNQPVYSMAPQQQGYPGMPPQQQQQQQQHHRQYAVPTSYQMQANMNLPPNYVLPNSAMSGQAAGQSFPVSMQQTQGHMAMSMGYGQYSLSMMNDARGMGMPAQGQSYPATSMQMGGGSVGVAYHQNGMPMVSQAYAMPQGLSMPPPHPPVAGSQQPEPLAPVTAPSVSNMSTASKLATPREEWGSSQTPRSHLIMTEGHASAYELFHQQRLRLMLKERDKGMSLISAPSPGQAMLTKELKANKERQKRQEMMQQGWKSAVDAMMSLTTDSLEDSDNLMEKVVGLSALDPVDDELIGGDVEINLPSEDTLVEPEEPILITDSI